MRILKIFSAYLIFGLCFACNPSGNKFRKISSLPKELEEASGVTTVKNSDLLWMHNDSGNKNKIYGVTLSGEIEKEVKINAKNVDWEDITSDEQGNLYIGDFGNNKNKRKNLVILKVLNENLSTKDKVEVQKIKFSYSNQNKFPPKKNKRFFDAESFFYFNKYLYVFTKSRVKKYYGITNLYRIPAQKGNYVAELIGTYTNCSEKECWVTAAAISPNKKRVALLTSNSVLIFSNFTSDNFLKGDLTKIELGFTSQKEGLTFKSDNEIFITDEKAENGGDLYKLNL